MAKCFNANCPTGGPSQRLRGWCAYCARYLGTPVMRDSKEAKAA